MDLRPYVTTVQEQLAAAAELGDEMTQRTAAKLIAAVEPALRLALLAAAGAIVDDITVALLDVPGTPSLSVRLAGEGIDVDTRPAATQPDAAPPPEDTDYAARISLRLPDALKTQVDEAARRQGVSVNTWLVREISRAVSPSSRHGTGAGQRLSGWING